MAKQEQLSDEEFSDLQEDFNGTSKDLEKEKSKEDKTIDNILDDIQEEIKNEKEKEPEEEEIEEEEIEEEEEEEEIVEPEEEEPKAKKKPNQEEEEESESFQHDGIYLEDFITAEMAITSYQDFWVMLLSGVAMILKKDIDHLEDKIRVSSQVEEMAVGLLDVYWSTVKIKINPVLAAAILMAGANIKNFTDALQAENKNDKAPTKKKTRKKKKPNPPRSNNEPEDVEYEEVEEEEEAQEPGEEKKDETPEEKQKRIALLTEEIKAENEKE